MITTENPRRIAPQACPFCGELQNVEINGHTFNEKGELEYAGDAGYSFCNCKNIFFTNWENMKQAVYDESYAKKYDSQHTSNILSRYLIFYGRHFKELKPSGNVLDVGCINKTVLDGFKQMGYGTTALDIFHHDVSPHNIIVGDFENVTIPKESFDIIFASHVFEHFKNPLTAINKCHNILTKGGVLFVAMPDPWFIDWKNPYVWGHWHIQEHHILWDMDSFARELENNGFKLVFARRNYGYDFICIGDFHIMAVKE